MLISAAYTSAFGYGLLNYGGNNNYGGGYGGELINMIFRQGKKFNQWFFEIFRIWIQAILPILLRLVINGAFY